MLRFFNVMLTFNWLGPSMVCSIINIRSIYAFSWLYPYAKSLQKMIKSFAQFYRPCCCLGFFIISFKVVRILEVCIHAK